MRTFGTLGVGVLLVALIMAALTLFVVDSHADTDGDALPRALIVTYTSLVLGVGAGAFFGLLKGRIGWFILMASHFVWFAWPAFLSLSEGRYFGDIARYRLPPETVTKCTLLFILFLALNLVGYVLASWRTTEPSSDEPQREFIPQIGPVMGVFFLLGVLPYFVLGGSFAEIVAQISAARSVDKPWSQGAHVVAEHGPAVVLARASLVTFSALGVWLVFARRTYRIPFWLAAFLAFSALLGLLITFFDSGTRTWTIIMIGPAALAAFSYRIRQRHLIRGTLTAAVALLLAVALVQLQRFYRFTSTITNLEVEQVVELQDNDFFTESAIAMDLVPRFGYLNQFEPALYVTNFIPRFLWENKPYSQTLRFFTLGRSGFDEYLKTGTSRMPGVVGQHYMSWGLTGVVIAGLAWGALFGWFESLFRRGRAWSLHAFFGALGLVFMFTSARGLYPGFHYPLVITLVLFLVRRLLERRSDGAEA